MSYVKRARQSVSHPSSSISLHPSPGLVRNPPHRILDPAAAVAAAAAAAAANTTSLHRQRTHEMMLAPAPASSCSQSRDSNNPLLSSALSSISTTVVPHTRVQLQCASRAPYPTAVLQEDLSTVSKAPSRVTSGTSRRTPPFPHPSAPLIAQVQPLGVAKVKRSCVCKTVARTPGKRSVKHDARRVALAANPPLLSQAHERTISVPCTTVALCVADLVLHNPWLESDTAIPKTLWDIALPSPDHQHRKLQIGELHSPVFDASIARVNATIIDCRK